MPNFPFNFDMTSLVVAKIHWMNQIKALKKLSVGKDHRIIEELWCWRVFQSEFQAEKKSKSSPHKV